LCLFRLSKCRLSTSNYSNLFRKSLKACGTRRQSSALTQPIRTDLDSWLYIVTGLQDSSILILQLAKMRLTQTIGALLFILAQGQTTAVAVKKRLPQRDTSAVAPQGTFCCLWLMKSLTATSTTRTEISRIRGACKPVASSMSGQLGWRRDVVVL
jgi:hypothetical protein